MRAALDGTARSPSSRPARPRSSTPPARVLRPEEPLEDGADLVVVTSGSTGGGRGGAAVRRRAAGVGGRHPRAARRAGQLAAGAAGLGDRRPAGAVPQRAGRPAASTVLAAGRDPGRRGRPHAGRPPLHRRWCPTQLRRFLDAEPDALRAFDAVLVGGAATDPALLARARAAGVARRDHLRDDRDRRRLRVRRRARWTASGVRVDRRRIELAGPMLALGYRLDPGGDRGRVRRRLVPHPRRRGARRRRPAHRARPARRRRDQRRGQRRARRRRGGAARAPGRRRRRRLRPARRRVGAAGRRRRRPRPGAAPDLRRRCGAWVADRLGAPGRPAGAARRSTPSRCCTPASPTAARSPARCPEADGHPRPVAGRRPAAHPARGARARARRHRRRRRARRLPACCPRCSRWSSRSPCRWR